MFGRRRTSRAQARRDREWRRFVRDLTEPARQLSPAEDERLRAFLEDEAQPPGQAAPQAQQATRAA